MLAKHVPCLSLLVVTRSLFGNSSMLLTHSSGVTYDWMDPEADKYRQFVGLPPQNDYKKVGLKLPLRFAPGEGWGYSASLDWLGLAMEKVVGMTMGEYMRTKIFEPLGMTRTTFDPDALATTPKSLAPVMYRGQDGALTSGPSLIKYEERDYDSAGAGLYSTANDYAKVLHAILKKDVPGLSKDTYDLLFKPQLGDAAKSHLAALSEPLNDLLWPDFPPGMPADHSLAAMINEKDIPGRRSAGSIKWLGAASTHWVCAVVPRLVVTPSPPTNVHASSSGSTPRPESLVRSSPRCSQ